MRKQFDIKFRPQIESGEYKLETECGHPASVMDWEWITHDKKKVLAIKVLKEGGLCAGYLFDYDGKRHSIFPAEEDSSLFLITLEPELTEFEKALKDIVNARGPKNPMTDEGARNNATILLDLAERQLLTNDQSNHIWSDGYDTGYELGTSETLKDLPRWKKVGADTGQINLYKGFLRAQNYLEVDGHRIMLSELEKLPGFKED